MNTTAGFIGLAAFFVLVALKVPVAIAMAIIAFVGVWSLFGLQPAIGLLANTPYEFVASWTLSAVPMFLLMGFVAYYSGLTGGLFDAAKLGLRKVPGGLGIAAILACSGFATVCGSSLATAASMGRIAIPEMVKAGYKPSFATGALAAGGTIGALIPPSILMIIYGVFSETSVSQVFIGGVTVGLLTAASYIAVVLIVAALRPDIVPRTPFGVEDLNARQVFKAVWPVIALILLIFGGLFSGQFTATEAGAIGAMGAIVLAAVTGKMNWDVFRRSVLDTLGTCASLFIVGVGAVMFTKFLGLSGAAGLISAAVQGYDLDYVTFMVIVVVIYLILGTFMEPFGAMLVTLPVLMPVLAAEGINMVWFGVFLVKMLEIGMITPPLGMNVFVIRNVASQYATLGDIFRGVALFFVADMVVVALIVAFPIIVLFLPQAFG
jgi:tripartite ATP-independent transporter DctM subunit